MQEFFNSMQGALGTVATGSLGNAQYPLILSSTLPQPTHAHAFSHTYSTVPRRQWPKEPPTRATSTTQVDIVEPQDASCGSFLTLLQRAWREILVPSTIFPCHAPSPLPAPHLSYTFTVMPAHISSESAKGAATTASPRASAADSSRRRTCRTREPTRVVGSPRPVPTSASARSSPHARQRSRGAW